jgi:large-conductance mechanosensitive channel
MANVPQGGPELEELKQFAMRGNVLDMAAAIIIGATAAGIVASFVGTS